MKISNLPIGRVLALLLLTLPGCHSRPDFNDRSPPTIRWILFDQTANTQQTQVGTGTLTLPKDHHCTALAIAEDPSGIDRMVLTANRSLVCGSIGSDVRNTSQLRGQPQTIYFPPNAQGEGLTMTLALHTHEGFECWGEGKILISGRLTVHCHAYDRVGAIAGNTLFVTFR